MHLSCSVCAVNPMHEDYDNLSSHRMKALDPMIVAVLRDMVMFVTHKKVQSVSSFGNREALRHEGDDWMQGKAHSSPRSGSLIRRAGEQV